MIGSAVELIHFILEMFGTTPSALVEFFTRHRTILYVVLALASAASVSTITSKIFGFYLRDLIYKALRFVFYCILWFIRGKTILLLCDADEHNVIAKNFARHLRAALKSKGLRSRVVTLSSGSAIAGFPLTSLLVRGIVIIITDVTPLSVEVKRRELVQRSLIKYTQSGGILILFHDVLYRRTRNSQLQGFAGGRITHFAATPVLNYVKFSGTLHSPKHAALMAELPTSFTLADKELIEGEWDASVEFLYVKAGTTDVPLVTRRVCGNGVVYWLNSGDTDKSGPASSIAVPESPLISITEKLIRFGTV